MFNNEQQLIIDGYRVQFIHLERNLFHVKVRATGPTEYVGIMPAQNVVKDDLAQAVNDIQADPVSYNPQFPIITLN